MNGDGGGQTVMWSFDGGGAGLRYGERFDGGDECAVPLGEVVEDISGDRVAIAWNAPQEEEGEDYVAVRDGVGDAFVECRERRVLDGGEEGVHSRCDIGGGVGVERAASWAGKMAFFSEESGDTVGVLEVSEPAIAGVVSGINYTVEDHPMHTGGLHRGECLAEDGTIREAPVLELLGAGAVCCTGEDGGRVSFTMGKVGYEVFCAFGTPFAMAFDDFDHIADDVRSTHILGDMLISVHLVEFRSVVGACTYLAEGTSAGEYIGKDFRVL